MAQNQEFQEPEDELPQLFAESAGPEPEEPPEEPEPEGGEPEPGEDPELADEAAARDAEARARREEAVRLEAEAAALVQADNVVGARDLLVLGRSPAFHRLQGAANALEAKLHVRAGAIAGQIREIRKSAKAGEISRELEAALVGFLDSKRLGIPKDAKPEADDGMEPEERAIVRKVEHLSLEAERADEASRATVTASLEAAESELIAFRVRREREERAAKAREREGAKANEEADEAKRKEALAHEAELDAEEREADESLHRVARCWDGADRAEVESHGEALPFGCES